MKSILISAFLLLLTVMPLIDLQACDVCGGAGDNVFGLLPSYKSRFLGIRYQYRHYSVTHPALFASEESTRAENFYQQADLWGRFGFAKNKLQLYASLPIAYNIQKENSSKYAALGLGDAQLLLQVQLLNSSDSASYKLRHILFGGAGLKLPTGKYQLQDGNYDLPAGMQPGSGSFDIPLNLIYTIQYRKVGLNTELNYKLNTTALKGAYRFGNRLSAGMQFLYRHRYKSAMLIPYANLNFELRNADRKHGYIQDFTGGQALSAGMGAECFLKNFAIGLSAQHPIYQNLGEGNIKGSWQIQGRVLFLF
jgi:hypothetical protein